MATRGKPQTPAAKQAIREREAELLKLRRGGLTWDLIAERTGYASAHTARQAYARALTRIVAEDVVEIRQLETERLDIAQSAIWGKVLQGDNASITNLLRIMERRAKLLGLDQPTRIQAEVITYDGNTVRAELERILASRSDSRPQSALASGSSETEPTPAGE